MPYHTGRSLGGLLLVGLLTVSGAAAQERGGAADDGRKVFFAQGCHGCHTLGAAGTREIGPDLSHIGTRYSEGQLARWLRDPSAQKPTAHMPRIDLTDAEVRSLAAFLASLR
jgi:cytochrome c2